MVKFNSEVLSTTRMGSDQAGGQRQGISDAFGRVKEVIEDSRWYEKVRPATN